MTWIQGIIPCGLAFALSLTLANQGLLLSNAHFYEMFASSTIVVTALMGEAMGKPFNTLLVPPMLGCVAGTVILAMGELRFSAIATVLILGAAVCRSFKANMQSIIMSHGSGMTQLDPLEVVVASSL